MGVIHEKKANDMTTPTPVTFLETDIERLGDHAGRVCILVDDAGRMDVAGRRVNRLTKGALKRALEAKADAGLKTGSVFTLAYPAGMAAEAVDVACVPRSAPLDKARAAGAALGRNRGKADLFAGGGQFQMGR